MTAQSLSAYHARLQSLLAPFADAQARDTGFLKRRSKLSGLLFVLTLVSAFWRSTPRSLAAYARLAEDLAPGLTVSPQSIDARFAPPAVALLRRVLAAVLHLRVRCAAQVAPSLAAFSSIYILDSTTISLPAPLAARYRGSGGAASASALKCFCLLEWFSGTIHRVLLRDGVKPDQCMGVEMLATTKPGALWLFDLGFWSIAFLAAIARHKSVFVCRLYGNVNVYAPGRGRLDVLAWLRGVEARCERRIVLGAEERLACRLIAERVPEAVAAQRRRKAKEGARRRRGGIRAQTLARMDWTLWITNADEEMVKQAHVGAIYRIRWQVELLFKTGKSTAHLDAITTGKPGRAECELYAGLIALVIAGHLGELGRAGGEALSLVKLWHALQEKAGAWARALLTHTGPSSFHTLIAWVTRHARPTKRKGTPSTHTLIANLELARPAAAADAP